MEGEDNDVCRRASDGSIELIRNWLEKLDEHEAKGVTVNYSE